jgi:hypothetical protein
MKNVCKNGGIIVLTAIMVFAFASCGSSGGIKSLGDMFAPLTSGRLVINGIDPKYDGTYLSAFSTDIEELKLIMAENIDVKNGKITGSKIANGSVTLNVWQDVDGELASYSGSDKDLFIAVAINTGLIVDIADDTPLAKGEGTANFISGNGEATVVVE